MAIIPDMDFMEYIDSIGIDYKQIGDELKFHHCPFCEGDGKTSKPYGIFYFNREKQVFNCYHKKSCGMQGTLYRFKLERGDVNPIRKGTLISYKKPDEKPEYTNDTEIFYKWYEENRGISKDILKKYNVGFNKINSKVSAMIYQYYNEEGLLFNRKYKMTDKSKVWTEKEAEKGYYGLQHIKYDEGILYVVEGEDDVHAFVQLFGHYQVVSVPYGAGSYTPAMDRINKKFNTLVLMFDCDDSGQEGARKFAEKAGLYKVHNVLLPRKDLRACILDGLKREEIERCIAACKRFSHDDILKAEDLKGEFLHDILDKKNNLGYMTPWKEFNSLTKGIRTSELSILIGHTGSGKTTFGYNLLLWAESAGMKTMAMSFENRMSAILLKLIEIETHETVRYFDENKNKMVITKERDWIINNYDHLNRKDIYFLNKDGAKKGYYDIEKLTEIIMYAVKFYDIKFFMIDHLHYFLNLSDAKNPVHKIDETIREIKQLTERYDIHILLLVHPFKTADKDGKSVKLGLNSGKGSSSISQEADNFLVISRAIDTAPEEYKSLVEMLKNREYGVPPENGIEFNLKPNKNTFYIEKLF